MSTREAKGPSSQVEIYVEAAANGGMTIVALSPAKQVADAVTAQPRSSQSLTLTGEAWLRIMRGEHLHLETLAEHVGDGTELEAALRSQLDLTDYSFEHCGTSWRSPWSCAADDECPVCSADISPCDEEPIRSLEENEDGTFDFHVA